MSDNHTKQPHNQDGEITDAALDSVSGGQGNQNVKVESITVTATRLKPGQNAGVRPIESIIVTATKLTPDKTQVASAGTSGKKPA